MAAAPAHELVAKARPLRTHLSAYQIRQRAARSFTELLSASAIIRPSSSSATAAASSIPEHRLLRLPAAYSRYFVGIPALALTTPCSRVHFSTTSTLHHLIFLMQIFIRFPDEARGRTIYAYNRYCFWYGSILGQIVETSRRSRPLCHLQAACECSFVPTFQLSTTHNHVRYISVECVLCVVNPLTSTGSLIMPRRTNLKPKVSTADSRLQ